MSAEKNQLDQVPRRCHHNRKRPLLKLFDAATMQVRGPLASVCNSCVAAVQHARHHRHVLRSQASCETCYLAFSMEQMLHNFRYCCRCSDCILHIRHARFVGCHAHRTSILPVACPRCACCIVAIPRGVLWLALLTDAAGGTPVTLRRVGWSRCFHVAITA